MSNAESTLSLEGLLEISRRLHDAAVHEAEAARHEVRGEFCRVSPDLLHSFMSTLRRAQSQHPTPYILSIPASEELIHPREFPVLTAQLLEGLRAVAAPTLTPEIISAIWDNPIDADYDDL